VGALRVTALTSVQRFRQTKQPVSAVATELGVGSVLEGTVAVQPGRIQGADPTVRVNVRLIRAGSDVELWSDSFDRPLADLLALQSDIARAVASRVRATLTRAEDAHLAQRPVASGPAQQAYLEALSYLAQNRRGAEVRPAVDALQRAIALDPGFAPPYAALARTYFLRAADDEIPQQQAYDAARAAAEHALALDPQLPDGHAALADVSFFYEWDWTAAAAEYNRAIALDGSNAYAYRQYANLLAAQAHTDAARQQADQAVAIDPLTADVLLTAGVMAYYQRHYDEASDILHRVIVMDPRFPGAYRTLARIEEARGNIAEAISLTDRALRLSDTAPAHAAALSLQAQAGHQAQARQGLAELLARLTAEHHPLSAPYEAYVRLALGEREAALDLLSQAVASRDQTVLWMRVDPRIDPLRADPRFQALVSRLGR
jgi:Tfp pilus assembly protein PilF